MKIKSTAPNRVELVRMLLKLPTYSDFARLVGVSKYRVGMWKSRGRFPQRPKQIKMLSAKTGLPEEIFKEAED